MASLPILEVAIGLSFVYLLLALVASTINEWVSRICSGRGRMLEEGIRRLVSDEDGHSGISTEILAHPLVQSMTMKGKRPSYISSEVFARAFADVMRRRKLAPQSADASGRASDQGEREPKRLLQSLAALGGQSGGQAATKADLELPDERVLAGWYDSQMERVSGWYKKRTQTAILIIAVVLTVGMNQDSVLLGRRLWTDSALRATVVEAAKARLALGPPLETVEYTDPDSPEPTAPVSMPDGCPDQPGMDDARNNLTSEEQALLSGLGGWSGEMRLLHEQGWSLWLFRHLPGWLMTAFAVSLGAPFWFDILKRFMNVRAAGVPPKDSRAVRK